MRTLRKMLSDIQAKVPSKPSPNEQAAFYELMAHLDKLAARKVSGDKTAQDGIIAGRASLRRDKYFNCDNYRTF